MAILIEPRELSAWRRGLPPSTRVAATNGCFDLLHVGHLAVLETGRQLGNVLLVGVNDDESIRELKGPSRPIMPLSDRLRLLMALACVDFVTWFSDVQAHGFLKVARPSVWFKGGDYTLDTMDQDERAALENIGAQITFLPVIPGQSTSAIITKIKALP